MPRTRITSLVVALALAVTACSGDDDAETSHEADPDTETSSTEFEKASVELEVRRADLVSPHAAKAFLDVGTRDAVADVVERLLLVTSAGPLVEGKAGSGFADLFTPDAGARAANADRDVFFDEDLPRFGEITPIEARVGMTGLAGSMDPDTSLVVAKFVWTVESPSGDRVARSGELSLIPDALPSGETVWRIGAYTIVVTRTVNDQTTTTTAATP